jgi:hypothetical protein
LRAELDAQAQDGNWPLEAAPRPLAAHDVKFPPYDVRTLANGMQVVVVLHHEQPAVTMRLLIRAGAAQDPERKPVLPSSSRICSTRERRRETPNRSPSRSMTSAAHSAPGRAPT